jgi:hypothetical protein
MLERMRGYLFVRQLSSFVGRAVVFLFGVSVLLFFFYALGSSQEFLDSTQLLILSVLRVTLLLEAAAGVWYAGFLVWRNVTERRPFVMRWLLLVVSLAICAVLLAALQFVRQWLQS